MGAPDARRLASLQDRLNYLFETVRPPGSARRYSLRQVADALRAEGIEVSPAYINHLCTGDRTNPGIRQAQGLAKFFGVPVSFLLDDDTETAEAVVRELEHLSKTRALHEALAAPEVQVIALKARGLSPAHLDLVSEVLDRIRKIEGLEGEPPR